MMELRASVEVHELVKITIYIFSCLLNMLGINLSSNNRYRQISKKYLTTNQLKKSFIDNIAEESCISFLQDKVSWQS